MKFVLKNLGNPVNCQSEEEREDISNVSNTHRQTKGEGRQSNYTSATHDLLLVCKTGGKRLPASFGRICYI